MSHHMKSKTSRWPRRDGHPDVAIGLQNSSDTVHAVNATVAPNGLRPMLALLRCRGDGTASLRVISALFMLYAVCHIH